MTADPPRRVPTGELHVLQVTDCHLFADPATVLRGVCTHASLARVLETACAERTPDAVLATGDLAEQPVPASYALFLETLRRYYRGPLLCVPGNHDHGATFAAHLPTADLHIGGWRLAGVDTHIDAVGGGSVGDGELARLAAALAGDAPTLVAGHHCPVAIGCRWLDVHRIDNGDELLAVLAAARVAAYVFGHIHQEFERPRPAAGDGPRLLGTPATCFQFARDTPRFALDGAEPGYRWLELAADGGVASRVGRVTGRRERAAGADNGGSR